MFALQILNQQLYEVLYQDILEFRLTFDLPTEDANSMGTVTDTLHTSLIVEELTELADADNLTKQADAIIDSVYVLMGRQVHIGAHQISDNIGICYFIDVLLQVAETKQIDFLACWKEIHSSNMSKACPDQDTVNRTIAHYANQGIAASSYAKGDYHIVKCARDTTVDAKTIKQGKVLKSIDYHPASLREVLTR